MEQQIMWLTRTSHNIAIVLLSIVISTTASATKPIATHEVYIAIVDCAFPPVTFSAMVGAFSADNIIPNFSSLAPGDSSKAVMHVVFEKVKASVKPETALKERLAAYFASKFTLDEAKEIATSCSASTGFTNMELLDRFQASLQEAPVEAQKQSVLVTCMFLGRYLTELSTALAPLTSTQLGLKTE